MRIVSLLPSATELVCGLDLRDQLVGVSHECDYPVSVVGLPVLTSSRIPEGLDSGEIDDLVTEQLKNDEALYDLNTEMLIDLKPDLIVTQALCDVCAVSGNDVARAVGSIPGTPQVINLEPICLDDVLQTVRLVAKAADCIETGREYLSDLRARIDYVGTKSAMIKLDDRPRVALLDWLDPLFDGGHWTPEIIDLAGGSPCFGVRKQPSQRRSWPELIDAKPDVIFVALCGFDIDRSMQDVASFLNCSGFSELYRLYGTKVFLVDGNAYFSRPGPRLVDALEIMGHALHPSLHELPEDLPSAMHLKI
ncbi:ABC transporter substrate-binding protein [Porticoccaceae bacterium]|nr:ABC transporter substrate-binding protein [Porticoccaceae bacterium]MDB2566307.1 ABC transporter substrate-binding protein [Porticoccaceae bacterium]MDB2621145.1 ABC transporter substrate-binding protein [Porticoccaceae bacterium]MDB2669607.1 ABC transporter substrate-binding protein [Porticoccaceae bacterium]